MTLADPPWALGDMGMLLGLERQEHFAATAGDRPWRLDLGDGMLHFGDDLSFRAEILGSWSAGNQTWLWSWANERSGLPVDVTRQALEARALGQRLDLDLLTTPSFACSDRDAYFLALMTCGALASGRGVYRAGYDGGVALILVTDDALVLPPPEAVGTARQIGRAVASGRLTDHRAALAWYCDRRGFLVDGGRARWELLHPDGASLVVSFDDQGRIAGVDAQAGPVIN